jgi:hypothetical protein
MNTKLIAMILVMCAALLPGCYTVNEIDVRNDVHRKGDEQITIDLNAFAKHIPEGSAVHVDTEQYVEPWQCGKADATWCRGVYVHLINYKTTVCVTTSIRTSCVDISSEERDPNNILFSGKPKTQANPVVWAVQYHATYDNVYGVPKHSVVTRYFDDPDEVSLFVCKSFFAEMSGVYKQVIVESPRVQKAINEQKTALKSVVGSALYAEPRKK